MKLDVFNCCCRNYIMTILRYPFQQCRTRQPINQQPSLIGVIAVPISTPLNINNTDKLSKEHCPS